MLTSTTSEQFGYAGVRSDTAAAEEMEKKANRTMLAVVDGDHAALASAFFSAQQDWGSKAMFLKGMEEANKFLPRDIDLLRGSATVLQVKEEASANCRGSKNRHNRDDVLEANLCRESKMMAPEPEESGEVIDEMIANGFQLFFREMEGLRISMGNEAGKKKSRKGSARSANGAVDLWPCSYDRLWQRTTAGAQPNCFGRSSSTLLHGETPHKGWRIISRRDWRRGLLVQGARCTIRSWQSASRLWTSSTPTGCTQ